MKDNAISYELAGREQQQQQQQQQHLHHHHHHHHQQQQQHHHSWNHQRQHQAHTTSVYANQQQAQNSQTQRSVIDHQQQNSHAAQLGQYHHQQLQPTAHHNSTSAAAAYYQQAHLYPTYQAHAHSQDHQAHSTSDHHLQASTVPAAATNAQNLGIVSANQAQHAVHQQQLPNNTQSSVVNTGWSPQGSLAPQAHHTVVTDHSTLAYMTHPYQSHNTPVSDHHRNSNGPISTQPIGSGPQASSYTVDSLYNSPAAAAAAAVAAYGYNNYNAAFFQSSNNGQHNQTGHHSATSMSAFWNQSQPSQQRTAQSQAVTGSTSVQQRQHIGTDHAANFMHDPRVYYGRPNYGQGIQNFGQTPAQPQPEVIHHRMNAMSQQQILQHQDPVHQVTHAQQPIHQQASVSDQQPSPTNVNQQNLLSQHQVSNQQSQVGPFSTNQSSNQVTRQSSNNIKPLSQNESNKPPKELIKAQVGCPTKQQPSSDQSLSAKQSHNISQQDQLKKSSNEEETSYSNPSNNLEDSNLISRKSPSSLSQNIESTNSSPVIDAVKSVSNNNYTRKHNNTFSQLQSRNNYRAHQDEPAARPNERIRKTSSSLDQAKSQSSPRSSVKQDSDPGSSLEEGIGSLAISSSRKTTWASIASQPAKVSQPKSLKSKIANSNSVLSSAKHLVAVSLDSSGLESKNGINPAIKSSVSAAATSIQRSSIPPPVSKMPTTATSLKLDLLSKETSEPSKISWPAVNASINLTLDEPIKKEDVEPANAARNCDEKPIRKDDGYRNRDFRDTPFKDHNHNHGSNAKMVNSYQSSHGTQRDHWNNRDQRDHRVRRNSDRKELDLDRQNDLRDDLREVINSRREYKPSERRSNNFRSEDHFRDRDFNKRGPISDRGDQRRGNENFQNSRIPPSRFESREFQPMYGNRHNENQNPQHHHYNNVRDGNASGNAKIDLKTHPHLNPANFNPKTFDMEPKEARYFIIKSYSEDDIHRSIKYSIWCSTNHGNKRLDEAYRQQQAKGGPIYLFFSVNGSGHFCGMAQMTSSVDFDSSSGVWSQSKWQGEFSVKWIYVKDVPNGALRHITLENNEDKPVTNSRDTQEVPSEKGKAVLKILHQYPHTTSLFDNFMHYERRQDDEKFKKSHVDQPVNRVDDRERGGGVMRISRPYMNSRPHHEFQNNRERQPRYAS